MDNLILKLRISSNNLEFYTGVLYQNYYVTSFDKLLNSVYKTVLSKYGNKIILEDKNVSKHNIKNKKECISRFIINIDEINSQTSSNIATTNGIYLQEILLTIKGELETYLDKMNIKSNFKNSNIKETELGLNNVLLYDFELESVNYSEPISTNVEPTLESTNKSIGDESSNIGEDESLESQEKSRDISNEEDSSVANIMGNNIQNIFPTTITLPAIVIEADGPEETQREIASHIGVFPFIYYNGFEINAEDILSFRLTSQGTVPSFTLIFRDSFGYIKDGGIPLDDTKIRFFLNSFIDDVKNIDIQFKISNYKTLSGGRYFISGILDLNALYVSKYTSYRGTSSQALQEISKSVGLGFNTNIQSIEDNMTWINFGQTLHDFTKHIVEHSYISDTSFIYGFTDYYYNYNFVDVATEINRDISSDVSELINSIERGLDPNSSGKPNIPFLTNENAMEGTNYHFRNFKVFNDSTELSHRTGYRTRTKYYDTISKELLAFDVASNMSGDDKSKIILRSPDEQYLNDNIIHEYNGKIDEDNMHKNYIYAHTLNERNITDLEKVGIIIELDNPNFSLYKFQKIMLLLSNNTSTVMHSLVNQRLSGEWIISDINYIVRRGVFKQEVILLRRELQLSEEEMEILKANNSSETFVNRTKFRNPTSGRNTDVGDYTDGYDSALPMVDDEPIVPLPGGELITAQEIKEIFGLSNTVINTFIVSLNNELKSNNYTTVYRIAHIIAQIYVESGFRPVQENLNYSAAGLLKTWPTRFNSSTAQQYARRPKAIANKVYSNRMGNSSESSGEGWKFSGKGFLQITGKENYEKCSKSLGVNLVSNPQLLLQVKYAMKSTFWYFKYRNLLQYVDKNDVKSVTYRINGGYIHLDKRVKYTQIAIRVLSKRKNK